MTPAAAVIHCRLMNEKCLPRGRRRWAAWLAVLLTVFTLIQPTLAAPGRTAALRYMDIALTAPGSGGARHDHDHTLCHSCAGHVCLEQHGSLGQTPIPFFMPPAGYALLIPRVEAVLWPHPPTAPPLRRIAQTPQARAPPSIT